MSFNEGINNKTDGSNLSYSEDTQQDRIFKKNIFQKLFSKQQKKENKQNAHQDKHIKQELFHKMSIYETANQEIPAKSLQDSMASKDQRKTIFDNTKKYKD